MKKLFYLTYFVCAIVVLSLIGRSAYAITATPTPNNKITPTLTPKQSETQEINQIEKIKDLVASKVAELKLVDKRGIIGTVKSSGNTEIKIIDYKNKEKQIDIDELTKFQSDNEDESFGISDIKNGDSLSIIGLFNKETDRLLARFIEKATNIPQNIEGIVTKKDAKEFTFVIIPENGKRKTVSVETSTKTSLFDDGETTKSGFTKIEDGQRVVVVGFMDPKIKDQINASRIIHFGTIPPSAKMKQFASLSNEETPVSSGSAGKVAPIIKR